MTQENAHRTSCIIHDSADQFFREKIRALNKFEAQFDKRVTVRLQIGRLVRCYELERVFENYHIVGQPHKDLESNQSVLLHRN